MAWSTRAASQQAFYGYGNNRPCGRSCSVSNGSAEFHCFPTSQRARARAARTCIAADAKGDAGACAQGVSHRRRLPQDGQHAAGGSASDAWGRSAGSLSRWWLMPCCGTPNTACRHASGAGGAPATAVLEAMRRSQPWLSGHSSASGMTCAAAPTGPPTPAAPPRPSGASSTCPQFESDRKVGLILASYLRVCGPTQRLECSVADLARGAGAPNCAFRSGGCSDRKIDLFPDKGLQTPTCVLLTLVLRNA